MLLTNPSRCKRTRTRLQAAGAGRYRTRLGRLFVIIAAMCCLTTPHTSALGQPSARAGTPVYLPLVSKITPWYPLGLQVDGVQPSSALLDSAEDLRVGWMRGAIVWRDVQPNEGGPIRWERLQDFDRTVQALAQRGIRSQIVIYDSPAWATINKPFQTSCGAIRSDKFAAFADFMRQIIARYKQPQFNIHDWELGNEVDVDPSLLGPDSWFGCWGDINDPYYGGRQYGEMLKVVTPVMRAEDSAVRVWHAGLLLDNPNTTAAARGKPERFLNGVLEAGGGPYFDVLAFHGYATFGNKRIDYERDPVSAWYEQGGVVIGKARFLKKILSDYGLSKPLFLNETSLMCPDTGKYRAWCVPTNAAFTQMQSIYLVRSFTRGMAEGLIGMTWFSLNGPGWRSTGLLHGDTPTPAYNAYRQLINQLWRAELQPTPSSYGSAVEAYAFRKEDSVVQVVWATQDKPVAIKVPRATFISASDMLGKPITARLKNDSYTLDVPFEPIYITVQLP